MQKYALLVGKQILEGQEFFNDWKADNYGGYSTSVAICVSKLAKEDYIESREFTYDHDKKVNRYTITEKGSKAIHDFLKTYSEIFERIKQILAYYHPKKLLELLDNVYALYPDLTVKSKIKADVNRSIVANNSYLSPEFEIVTDNVVYAHTSSPPANEHVFGDDYFREKLAKSLGLKHVPKLDPKSFDRLTGIISSKIKTEDFDSVELVKTVRGC
ncbi:MAG: hypothetical protein ACRDFB_02760 [Rhabdochlamydiaceae bacterium]